MRTITVYNDFDVLLPTTRQHMTLEDAKLLCFVHGCRIPTVGEVESMIYYLAFNPDHGVDTEHMCVNILCVNEDGNYEIASTEVGQYTFHQHITWYDYGDDYGCMDEAEVFPVRDHDPLAFAA